jgi:hypothetical protein
MPVQKLSDSVSTAAGTRTAALGKETSAKIVSATRDRAAKIAKHDSIATRLGQEFVAGTRKFTLAQVRQISASLQAIAADVTQEEEATLAHLNTAMRLALPTQQILAQAEDLASLRGKVSILQRVCTATIAAEDQDTDLLQVDDAGYVVDDNQDVMDDLPPAPEPTAGAPDGLPGAVPDQSADPMAPPVAAAPPAPPAQDPMAPPVAAAPPAPPAGPNPLADMPTDTPAMKAKKASLRALVRKAEQSPSTQTEKPTDSTPAGVPIERDTPTNSKGDPAKPKGGAPTPTTQTETPTDSTPAGVPNPAGDSNGSGPLTNVEPSTKEPSTSLSSKSKAGDAPDFLQDQDGDSDEVKSAKATLRAAAGKAKTKASDGDNGANGQNEDPSSISQTVAPSDDSGLNSTAAEDGDENQDGLELPTAAIDDVLASEIFAAGDFPPDDDAPAADAPPADLKASAKTARQSTAARTPGASATNEADAIRSMFGSEILG